MIWVAAAGPAMNILLAAISVALLWLVFHAGRAAPQWLVALLWSSVEINLVLAVLNMWPIPPLDGSRVAVGVLPPPPGAAAVAAVAVRVDFRLCDFRDRAAAGV